MLGEVLRERLHALGWEQTLKEQEILTRWDEAVGPQIARRAQPLYVSKHRLTVAVDNPAWAQQLAMLKKDLLRRIRSLLGNDSIEDLFFTSGRIERLQEKDSPSALEENTISPEVKRRIDEEASRITDVGLREAFRNVLLAANRRRKTPP